MKRTKLMAAWAEFCAKTPLAAGVISFQKVS
jgi:hypothetical protein